MRYQFYQVQFKVSYLLIEPTDRVASHSSLKDAFFLVKA